MTTSKNYPTVQMRRFVYAPSRESQGIIAYLTRECGGNVHEKGIVEVIGSTCIGESYQAKNAADLGTESYFWSDDEPKSWIRYDFRGQRVIPCGYVVGTSPESGRLKEWVFEGSKDGISWVELDRREEMESFMIKYFQISPVPREKFRFIQFKQTGANGYGTCDLMISSLEIFGNLCKE